MPHINNTMKKKSLSKIILLKLLLVFVLCLADFGCTNSKKIEEECSYTHPRGCEDFIGLEIFNRGSRLPADGIVLIKDWTFYLTYFDNSLNKLTEKYITVDCNCEVLYFGDRNPYEDNNLF